MKTTIDSQQLRVYVCLARTLNMSRAAAELGLTASGVSLCLKALEADLGCRLFERDSRHFTLTAAGREFLGEAEQILERMKLARGKLRASSQAREGHLRIGAGALACERVLPAALREFRESWPATTIKLTHCSARDVAPLLLEDQLDLALVTGGVAHARLALTPLAEENLQFLVHPLHPWAVKRKVVREEIPRQRLILPPADSAEYALIESYFLVEGIRARPFIELSNEPAAVELVRLDLGAAILPDWLAAEEVERSRLARLPLGRRRLKRSWGALRPNARELNLAENLFVEICRSILRSVIGAPAP